MDRLEFHPLANLFPMMDDAALQELAADIKANGLEEMITVYEDKVLDGRNRYQALLINGIDPAGFICEREREYFPGDDPLAYVLSKNLHRRHLDASQRAMVASKLANMKHGGNRKSADQAAPVQVARKAAAAALNVSERSVASAAVVSEHGAPELIAAVDAGDIPVKTAAELAREPVEAQRAIIGSMPRNDKGKLTPEAKRIAKARIREIEAATADEPAQAEGTFPVHFGSCAGGRVVTERTSIKTKADRAAAKVPMPKPDVAAAADRAEQAAMAKWGDSHATLMRHGATSQAQEYLRDVEMREAIKAAEEKAYRAWHDSEASRAWHDSRPHFPPTMAGRQQARAWEQEHGSFEGLKAEARAAARRDLRAKWAMDDAAWSTPLAPHITRITPDDLQGKIESETLRAKREAYVAEARRLDVNMRKNELKRLVQALDLTGDVSVEIIEQDGRVA